MKAKQLDESGKANDEETSYGRDEAWRACTGRRGGAWSAGGGFQCVDGRRKRIFCVRTVSDEYPGRGRLSGLSHRKRRNRSRQQERSERKNGGADRQNPDAPGWVRRTQRRNQPAAVLRREER